MAANALKCEIRLSILTKLQHRNEDEKSFSGIVLLTNSLSDTVDFLQKENLRLRIQNEKLEQRHLHPHSHGHENCSSMLSTEQVSLLEKKIYLLQEELTEVHRRKGEFAQQIIDLRNALDIKDKDLLTKCSELHEVQKALTVSEEVCKQYKHTISEAELNLQSIKDEYDALLLSYSSLEEKKIQLDKEHQNLICQWMAFKARDADRLNAETEKMQKLKQAKLQKDLEEAAREPVTLDSRRLKNALCIEAAIPLRMMTKFESHDGEVNAAAWFSSGTKFVTGGGDRKVKLWEVLYGSQPVLKGVAHESNSSVMSIDFDFEDTFVIGSSCDFASRVWTVNDLKIRHTLTGHSGKVMAAKFLGESSKVVSGSHDRTLKIWDLRRRACIRTIFAGSSCNDIVTCIGNDSTVVSGHFDKRIRFWDSRTDSSKNEILLQGKITSLDISRDGFSLLSCARDDSLKLIDFRMNRVVRTFNSDGFVVGCDWTRARFSPDIQYCVAGSQDGSIFIWVISTGKVEKILKEHSSTVTTCSWSSDGRMLISCDKNKKSIIWSNI